MRWKVVHRGAPLTLRVQRGPPGGGDAFIVIPRVAGRVREFRVFGDAISRKGGATPWSASRGPNQLRGGTLSMYRRTAHVRAVKEGYLV